MSPSPSRPLSEIVRLLVAVSLILCLTLTPATCQYYLLLSENRYMTGTYKLSFSSAHPVSLGSCALNSTTVDSSTFKALISSETVKEDLIIKFVASSKMGDYLAFKSLITPFNVKYDISLYYEQMDSTFSTDIALHDVSQISFSKGNSYQVLAVQSNKFKVGFVLSVAYSFNQQLDELIYSKYPISEYGEKSNVAIDYSANSNSPVMIYIRCESLDNSLLSSCPVLLTMEKRDLHSEVVNGAIAGTIVSFIGVVWVVMIIGGVAYFIVKRIRSDQEDLEKATPLPETTEKKKRRKKLSVFMVDMVDVSALDKQ